MKCICKFDPRADKSEVQQHVAIDLAEAVSNSVVPSQVSDEDLQYGNIESPSAIYGRPSDVFDAMQQNRAFSEALASKSGPKEE